MAKKSTDPLEAAKIGDKSSKKSKDKAEAKADAKDPEAPAAADKAPEPPKAAETKPEAPKAKAEKAAGKKAAAKPAGIQKYRVIADCTFSRNGAVTKLKAGSVISSQHYGGPAGMEQMAKSGVQMERIED